MVPVWLRYISGASKIYLTSFMPSILYRCIYIYLRGYGPPTVSQLLECFERMSMSMYVPDTRRSRNRCRYAPVDKNTRSHKEKMCERMYGNGVWISRILIESWFNATYNNFYELDEKRSLIEHLVLRPRIAWQCFYCFLKMTGLTVLSYSVVK